MKFLQDYIEEKQSLLFKECNAFFAFSNEQFEEQKKEGIKYVNCSGGLICDKSKVEHLLSRMDEIHKEGIAQDIEENGIENIILRELYNYECFYTGNPSDAISRVKDYDISKEEVLKAFYKESRTANI